MSGVNDDIRAFNGTTNGNTTTFTSLLFNGDNNARNRQQIIRIGTVICLILMLLDSSNRQFTDGRAIKTNNNNNNNNNNGIPTANSLPQDFTNSLNIIAKGSSLVDGFDELVYPRNLTGMFRGVYSKNELGTESKRNLVETDNRQNSDSRHISGKLLMQLRSVSIPNVYDLHFVYGVIKLYGAGPRMADMLLPVQGISLPNVGVLTLLITPFKNQKLYLQLPDGNLTNYNNNGIGVNKEQNTTLKVKINSEISKNETDLSNILLSSNKRRHLLSTFHKDMNSLDMYMHDKYHNSPKILPHQRRRLSATDSITSVAVGNSGMTVHLVDGAKPNIILSRRNDTKPSLISVIGENALPLAFKNLQDIVAQGNRTYYIPTCLEAVKLTSKPLDIQAKDYNEKLTKANDASISMTMDGFVDSTNCAIAYNISAASFILPLDILDNKARHYSVIAVFVCMIQIGLLVLQSRYAQNQAAASKISITGICALSLLDAALCIVHFLMCTILPKIFFAYFMWIAVLKLLMFCVFEMRTVVMIYQARFAQELSTEGWMGLRRRLASLHLRFYMSLFVMMFLAFIFHSRPKILIIIFYSFWWPQIYHNASSGTRKAFHLMYLWGTAVSRLFIPLYFIGCPHNFLHILLDQPLFEASFSSCLFLIFWVFLQAGILTAQDKYGSRFFIPSYLLPSKYDYFRYVNPNTIRSSSVHTDGIDQDEENGNLCECVICYNGIQLQRGSYMITPCDHLFHTDCLKTWLEVKLECPFCRSSLPADDTT